MVVDCGRNWLGLPTLGNKIYYCERLSSKHLAINLSSPQWWKEVPLSLSLGPGTMVTLAKADTTGVDATSAPVTDERCGPPAVR